MCAHGAGIRMQSSGPSPWAGPMMAALYASVACVCSTPFGAPLDPDVHNTAAQLFAVRTSTRSPPCRAGARRDRARRSVGRPPARVRLRRPRPGGAPVPRSRRCASTRDRRATTSGRLGACHATTSPGTTPAARSPPATPATAACSAGGATAVSSASSVGRSHAPPAPAILGRDAGAKVGGEHAQARWRFQPSLAGVAPRNTLVPTKLRWISTVPAPMHNPRMSRYTRSTGYSRQKP